MTDGLFQQIKLCLYLTRMEFEKRFVGSVGGKLWVFISPLLTIGVIWAVIDLGLGMRQISGPEYGMNLAVGLCAWFFFVDAVSASVSSILGSPHLVKKVVFPVALLPLSSVLAAFVVHLIVLAVIMAAMIAQGHSFGLSLISLPFWALGLLFLAAATGLLVASLNVIFRDVGAIAPNVLSFMFWLTPVIWPISNLNEMWKGIALVNPAAVLVEGYRYALLGTSNGLGPAGILAYCGVFALYVFGTISLFRKMRPLFANVL
jgi:ABC-type polysaccharide/polyol phosphate export permease